MSKTIHSVFLAYLAWDISPGYARKAIEWFMAMFRSPIAALALPSAFVHNAILRVLSNTSTQRSHILGGGLATIDAKLPSHLSIRKLQQRFAVAKFAAGV